MLIGTRKAPNLVVDAKWAAALVSHHGTARMRNEHLYQLATYCEALGCDGTLVYPRQATDVDTPYRFAGRRLRILTVDLAPANLANLAAVADGIVQQAAAAVPSPAGVTA